MLKYTKIKRKLTTEVSLCVLLEWRRFGECAGCKRASSVCSDTKDRRWATDAQNCVLWIGSGLCFFLQDENSL